MKRFFSSLFAALLLLSVTACGEPTSEEPLDYLDKQLNEITAAKSRFAVAKTTTPVLNTHDWDLVFGGPSGNELKYDRYGEIDEVVFVALEGTVFTLQRQIRKETRAGKETIYYKVNSTDHQNSGEMWIDGRFLDVSDVQPKDTRKPEAVSTTLISLRRFAGAPYVWHGASDEGIPELLQYYPPAADVSERTKDDWKLRGFDSPGLLYQASNGATPLDMKSIARFGEAFHVDLSDISPDPGNDDPNAVRIKQAQRLLGLVRPLDIIVMGDRMWTVLDGSEVIESKYISKFAGKAQISSLYDTLYGLLQKAVFVENPFEELDDPNAKRFYIRRYADTSALFPLEEEADPSDTLEDSEALEESDSSATEEDPDSSPSPDGVFLLEAEPLSTTPR